MSRRRQAPAVVAFGGGHGLSAALSALRYVTPRLTAVVTVADDGGSSGRLRDEFEILPPGDLRMALAALCAEDDLGRTWADVLQSRFAGGGPLAGHAIGNLLIAGLWQRLEDPVAGLDMVGALLRIQGRVLPMAAVPLTIEADVVGSDPRHPDDLAVLRGQATVAKTGGDVRAVRLLPSDPPARPESVQSVLDADHVVLGPGSWFTSVIPHLLVPQLAEAIVATKAQRILTMNLVPADETDGFPASRHLEVLADHCPALRLDAVIIDPAFAADDPPLERFARSLGARLVVENVRMRDGSPRHDPHRLAAVYAELMQ